MQESKGSLKFSPQYLSQPVYLLARLFFFGGGEGASEIKEDGRFPFLHNTRGSSCFCNCKRVLCLCVRY